MTLHVPVDSVLELLRVAADREQSEAARFLACLALRPQVHEIARAVARRLSGQVANDLLDEAESIIFRALRKFDGNRRAWRRWMGTILRNHARSRQRQCRATDPLSRARTGSGHQGLLPPELANLVERQEPNHSGDELAQRAIEIQIAARRLRESLSGGSVNTYAVLLLVLRLQAVERARASYEPGVEPPVGETACAVERLLPWTDEEAHLRVRPGLATLGEVWQALAPRLGAARLAVEAVCEALSGPVKRQVWCQWVRRTRLRTVQAVGQEPWGQGLLALLARAMSE
jgi:hypothetical protein